MRTEKASPNSEPIAEEVRMFTDAEPNTGPSIAEGRRSFAFDMAMGIETHNAGIKGAATIAIEAVIESAQKIEAYLSGGTP